MLTGSKVPELAAALQEDSSQSYQVGKDRIISTSPTSHGWDVSKESPQGNHRIGPSGDAAFANLPMQQQ